MLKIIKKILTLKLVGEHVRISKYKKVFAKGCTPSCSEEVFVIGKSKNTVSWTCVIEDRIEDFKGKEIVGTLYKRQKTNQTEFRVEKAIKKKR